MNVNPYIQKLEEITGLEVAPDIYEGEAESYIVYNYSGERPVFFGDDVVLADTVTLQVNLYTPPKFDYMELKETIRDYLETLGIVDSIGSWIDTWETKNSTDTKIRHTAYTVDITKER